MTSLMDLGTNCFTSCLPVSLTIRCLRRLQPSQNTVGQHWPKKELWHMHIRLLYVGQSATNDIEPFDRAVEYSTNFLSGTKYWLGSGHFSSDPTSKQVEKYGLIELFRGLMIALFAAAQKEKGKFYPSTIIELTTEHVAAALQGIPIKAPFWTWAAAPYVLEWGLGRNCKLLS